MIRFIKLHNGSYVNTDLIGEVRNSSENRYEWTIFDKKGGRLGQHCAPEDCSPDDWDSAILPAEPGYYVVEVEVIHDTETEEESEEYEPCEEYRLHRIIAWRIDSSEVLPICLGLERREVATAAILQPDGKVVAPLSCVTWNSLDDYIQHSKREIAENRAWDALPEEEKERRHAATRAELLARQAG